LGCDRAGEDPKKQSVQRKNKSLVQSYFWRQLAPEEKKE